MDAGNPEKLTVRCVCGWETTGSADEVVAATQEHGRRVHNMLATREDVLMMVAAEASAPVAPDPGAAGRS